MVASRVGFCGVLPVVGVAVADVWVDGELFLAWEAAVGLRRRLELAVDEAFERTLDIDVCLCRDLSGEATRGLERGV